MPKALHLRCMPQRSLDTVTQLLHRQSVVIFGCIALVFMLAGLLVLSAQHVLTQERARFTSEFTSAVAYAQEQEQLLKQLHSLNERITTILDPHSTDTVTPTYSGGVRLDHSPRHQTPYAVHFAQDPPSEIERLIYLSIGSYLADYYTSFWASSSFPASSLLLINPRDGISISIPPHKPSASPVPLLTLIDQIAQNTSQQPSPALPNAGNEVQWLALPSAGHQMLGFIAAGLSAQSLNATPETTPRLYLATLLDRTRLQASSHSQEKLQYDFWLTHSQQGVLLGNGPAPQVKDNGFSPLKNGLVLRLSTSSGPWAGYFLVDYGNFFEANIWLPLIGLLLLVFCVIGRIAYVHWYKSSVIEPARKAQEELLASEMFNRTLIETAPVALCLLTRRQGRVVFATHLAQEWLGLQHQANPDLPGPLNSNSVRQQLLQTQVPGVIEQINLSNGRSLHLAYAPTRYRQQDVILCALTDITASTEEQRALERARIAADEASKAKSRFLATMSHEIRTPLYSILGTLELLSLSHLNPQQKQHVERIQSASQILMLQISDILDISKIEAGQLHIALSECNPRELVQSCTASFAAMAQQKNLLLFCVIDTEIPETLMGDATHIQQILANLISNAIKFTDVGQIIIRLKVIQKNENRFLLNFEVADTGIGIASENIEELFDPFYIIDASRHTIRGAGLGLSICDRLAQLQGGSIHVSSVLGIGSIFSLHLELEEKTSSSTKKPQLDGFNILVRSPHAELSNNICQWLKFWNANAREASEPIPSNPQEYWLLDIFMQQATHPEAWSENYLSLSPHNDIATQLEIETYNIESIAYGLESAARKSPKEKVSHGFFKALNLRILVAEDNPINQITLKDQLEQIGCIVDLTKNGEEALAQWESFNYDLILTDINMPYMNGFELARELRSRGMEGPIIGITANALKDDELHGLQSGMTACLVKPIKLAFLYQKLSSIANINKTSASGSFSKVTKPHAFNPVPEKYKNIFIETMSKDLIILKESLLNKNIVTILQKLHRIRGGLAAVDNLDFANSIFEVEDILKNKKWDDDVESSLFMICQSLQIMIDNARITPHQNI
ncbi:response regulator [Comamonas composti]|uniref:response regulator n=1 Tax=Comamonas composti TaxID=408558 RepID=UPI001B7F7FF4|nr:response regulator [Comamonas composti]